MEAVNCGYVTILHWNMNKKQTEDMDLVARFLCELGWTDVCLEAGDRPDVVALINRKSIGIEVTKFHADERPTFKGSTLRVEEKKKVSKSGGGAYAMWGVTNLIPGLVTRINEKIKVATTYDHTCYEQLWLLISSQIPMVNAVVSTFAFPLDISELNDATHAQLCRSLFSAVHFHLMMTHGVYSWSRTERWQVAKIPATLSGLTSDTRHSNVD